MPTIDEILRLPKQEQAAIMEAIQENLEDEDVELNEEQIAVIKKRIEEIENGNHKTYTWDEVKQALANKWNTQ